MQVEYCIPQNGGGVVGTSPREMIEHFLSIFKARFLLIVKKHIIDFHLFNVVLKSMSFPLVSFSSQCVTLRVFQNQSMFQNLLESLKKSATPWRG